MWGMVMSNGINWLGVRCRPVETFVGGKKAIFGPVIVGAVSGTAVVVPKVWNRWVYSWIIVWKYKLKESARIFQLFIFLNL